MSHSMAIGMAARFADSKLEPERLVDALSLVAADVASEYLRTYHEWRVVYGLQDSCINELRLAILVECEREALSVQQRDRLERLARLILREQERCLSPIASKPISAHS